MSPGWSSYRREEGMRGPTLQTHVCDGWSRPPSHRSMMVPGWTFSVLFIFTIFMFVFVRFFDKFHRVQNTPPVDHAARHICICILQMCFSVVIPIE